MRKTIIQKMKKKFKEQKKKKKPKFLEVFQHFVPEEEQEV